MQILLSQSSGFPKAHRLEAAQATALLPKIKSNATLRRVFRQLLAQVTCEISTNALNANAHQASNNSVHLFSHMIFLSLTHRHPSRLSGLIPVVCPIILGAHSMSQSNKRQWMNVAAPNFGSASSQMEINYCV